jgi:hypothetical protein
VYIHDNKFAGGGDSPDQLELKAMKVAKFGLTGNLPDILWDGTVAKDRDVAGTQICIRANGDADFANIDYVGKLAKFSTAMQPHDCELPALQPVSWPGLDSSAPSS